MGMRVVGVEEAFAGKFAGRRPEFTADAGGRVNLLGDHTDYHEGFVLSAAMDLRTTVAGARRGDGAVRIFSMNEDAMAEGRLDRLTPAAGKPDWRSFLLGPLWAMRESRWNVPGMDILVRGNVPSGAGFKSVSSVQVALVGLCAALAGARISRSETARIARLAGNGYCRLSEGTADRLAVSCGERQNAVLIDCRASGADLVGFPSEWVLVTADSGVRRRAGAEGRTLREKQCASGLQKLRSDYPNLGTARDLNMRMLDSGRKLLDEVEYRRLRHVVSENARCLEAKEALRDGDAAKMGRLMAASHESLAKDYEVSCPELDALVEAAQGSPGAIGSRMTGEGLGGNTVSIVLASKAAEFRSSVEEKYLWRMRKRTVTRLFQPADGLVVRNI